MFLLRVTPPEGAAFQRSLESGELVVGRSPDCDLPVSGDATLSRRHARLRHDGRHLWVEDLGSSNGTLVNGVPIVEPTPLGPGDEVLLSSTRIAVEAPAVAAPTGRDVREEVEEGGGELTMLRPVSELLAEVEPDEATDARRHAARLRLLNELHRELGRAISLGEVLEQVLDGIFRHLRPEEAVLYLVAEEERPGEGGAAGDGDGEAAEAPLRVAASRPAGREPRLVSRTLRREVMGKGQAALAVDAQSDQRFAEAESIIASGVHSLVAAPLLDADGCLGMIVLSSRIQVHTFDEDDLELLASIAHAAVLRIRNLRLALAAAERERLESELRLARRIQVSLLPKALPELDGYRLYGANTPSRAVSGDYYQVVQRRDGAETAILLADVCGKGMAAALLTATLEAVCSALLEAGGEAPEVLGRACGFLWDRTPPDKFATACLAVLHAGGGRVDFVNAGHNPPLLLRAGGDVEELEATGFPLGIVPACDYDLQSLDLAPGDLLFLFTDGIVEAENPADEEYGLDRLRDLCRRHRDGDPRELAAALEEDLETFCAGVPQGDDRTYFVIQRTA